MSIPPPSGNYSVSIADYEWKEHTHNSLVRFYYPCDLPDESSKKAENPKWMPSWRYGQGLGNFLQMSPVYFVPVFSTLTRKVTMPVFVDLPLLKSSFKFPVMIFSHGLAGMRTTYSMFCTEMASQGYIVAAIEHRDGSGCLSKVTGKDDIPYEHPSKKLLGDDEGYTWRNNQLLHRVEEVKGCLELLKSINKGEPLSCSLKETCQYKFTNSITFKNALDLDQIVMAGHSFGGATAVNSCFQINTETNKTFKACISLDAWMMPVTKAVFSERVSCPTLFINNGLFQWESNVEQMEKLLSNDEESVQGPNERFILTQPETDHNSHSDFYFGLPKLMAIKSKMKVDPMLALTTVFKSSIYFLSHHIPLQLEHHKGEEIEIEYFSKPNELFNIKSYGKKTEV